MAETFSSRTELMLGESGYLKLKNSHVAVFGIGGVGGYAVEALARAGVGKLTLVDSDKVSLSNINRQIIATRDTVGQYKTEAAKDRILSINPECEVSVKNIFFGESQKDEIDLSQFDYIIDAIDSVSSKILLISSAKAAEVPTISAMGAGNKLDPTLFKVADISKTSVCPLAKAVRLGLRKLGINHLKVVYSEEPPASAYIENGTAEEPSDDKEKAAYEKRRSPGSISFVPSVMGLILAGEVIKDLSGINIK